MVVGAVCVARVRGYRSIVSTSRTVRLVAVLAGVLSLVLAFYTEGPEQAAGSF